MSNHTIDPDTLIADCNHSFVTETRSVIDDKLGTGLVWSHICIKCFYEEEFMFQDRLTEKIVRLNDPDSLN